MRYFASFCGFIALTAAAAIPRAEPATVTLRLITTPVNSNHYEATQQVPTTPKGNTLKIYVGQAISLDHDPLYLQAVEIAEITTGSALTRPPVQVEVGDSRVRCLVKTGHSSSGLAFGMEAGVVAFGGRGGGLATVTGVECWLEGPAETYGLAF
jgi:hypothetical protein